ncbi:MAG: glycosyltransferase family 39 protein [Streptosporangiaceae bacterium]
MTSPSGPAVIGGSARKGSRFAARPQAAEGEGFDPGPLWMRAVPSVAAFLALLIGITVPSFWRDEAATLAAVHRPFGDMVRMLGNVDAVHGAYYMLAWVIVRVFGDGELALRLPSAIAMAVAAGFVAAIGRRLISPRAGLAAGLVLILLPQIDFYGQDARSYALVVTVAAVDCYLLVRALQAAPGERRKWWFAYAAGIALLGILNIFGLLLVPANGLTVALRCLHPADGERRRTLALSWAGAAAAGCILASPLVYLGYLQRGQVSWLKTPDGLSGIGQLVGSRGMEIAAILIIAAGLVASALAGMDRLRANWPPLLAELCLPWVILPPAVLILGSLLTPMYTFRYIVFCIPAVALIVGAGIAALSRISASVALGAIIGAAVFVLFAAISYHSLVVVRQPGGHKDDIRQADQIVAASSHPGDVVLYTNPNAESFGAAYPYGLVKLRDIALAQAAIPSGTLAGTDAPYSVIEQRLAGVSRLWVVNINKNSPVSYRGQRILRGLHFHQIFTWRTSDIWLRLYVHR